MNIAYFDCFSGISGDMILGAFLDLGLPQKLLRQTLSQIPLPELRLLVKREERSHITGYSLQVQGKKGKPIARTYKSIKQLIEKSKITPPIKENSLAVFKRLAQVEGKIHGMELEDVHFHEVGAVDSIVDIVGTAIGIDHFQPTKIFSSELPMGRGFVQCQHGRLPLPAPATLEILKGFPIRSIEVEGELVTPTGAAIVAALNSGIGSMPDMKVSQIGYGMGRKEFPDRPNLLRLVLGEATRAYPVDQVVVLEANIDDMNPEFYDYLMDRLFEKGALDVSLSPLLMKKNRPGTLLRVIVQEQDTESLSEIILRESTTLGVRSYEVHRKKLPREVREVETKYGKVRVKGSGEMRFQPEYEDCKRIALEKGVPIQEVYREAIKGKARSS